LCPGVLVRVHDEEYAELGFAHIPLPIEIGDQVALADDPLPFVVADVVFSPPGAEVAALVKVERAAPHPT
jgi:hypothetical protein